MKKQQVVYEYAKVTVTFWADAPDAQSARCVSLAFSGPANHRRHLLNSARREIEKAELNKRKIIHNRSDFERLLAEQVSDAVTAFEEARKRAQLAAETVMVSRKNLDLISSAYREGMATEKVILVTGVAGYWGAQMAARLIAQADAQAELGLHIIGLDIEPPKDEIKGDWLPFLKQKGSPEVPTAFVCKGYTCLPPVI
jgi:hypothetical protein